MSEEEEALPENISIPELVRLGALDPLFFIRTFFPRTFRQPTPQFHRDILAALENPDFRHVAIEVFRGGAKTTLLRAYAARRIAYGLSRTVLFISRSQDYAIESVVWIQKQVQNNRLYADTFGLRPGLKWTLENSEIVHGVMQHSVRVLARGITGQNRGINIEDYRPDLIVVDDPDDEETTSTEEMRKKTSALFFGAIEKSLARPVDAPHSKIVLLQTPLHRDDLVESCLRDPAWHGLRFGCFDETGESRWPEQFRTEDLLNEKQSAIRRNQLSLWMREMECKIVSSETSWFRANWLKYWDRLPDGLSIYMVIDPAPPMSEQARTKGRDTDPQAMVVVGFKGPECYLLDYSLVRDANPEETVAEFFRLADKWRPLMVGVESVAYQRTLAWLLRDKMRVIGRFYVIHEIDDKRKKADRIRHALSGRASNGYLLVRAEHTDFIAQFTDYPQIKHDDLLDAVAMAITMARGGAQGGIVLEGEYERLEEMQKGIKPLDFKRYAL